MSFFRGMTVSKQQDAQQKKKVAMIAVALGVLFVQLRC